MQKKYSDYFQYSDFLTQYDKLGVTPRSPIHPPSTPSSTPPSHPSQPSSSSLHSYSSTLNSELYTTKKELHDCQLFLNEATNNFNFEKRINEDYKKNFTLLDQKYKQDIQSMKTALNIQKSQYEQMLNELKSKHTTNIKRIAQLENELSLQKTKAKDFNNIKQELNAYGEDLQKVINESKEKDAIIEQLKRKLQLMQTNSNDKDKSSVVNDNSNNIDYKRKYEIVVEQNEKLQESADKLQEMAKQLVSTLQTTKEKYEMKIQQQQNEIEKYKQQQHNVNDNTQNTMQVKDDEIVVKKEELSKILEANSNLVEMNELMMKKMDMINEIDPTKIVAEINSLKEENEYLKSQLLQKEEEQQQHI